MPEEIAGIETDSHSISFALIRVFMTALDSKLMLYLSDLLLFQMGPTAWIMCLHLSLPGPVTATSPVGTRPWALTYAVDSF